MVLLLVVLGLLAGVLTTVAGMGGGSLLLLALSLAMDPKAALACTAPALLLSNAHRLFLFRAHLDRRVALAFAMGALPGSLVGGLLVSWVSPSWVRAAMLGTTLLAIAQSQGLVRWKPPAAAILPAGFLVGVVAATAGGAAALVGPLLMATGLQGSRYIATVAACGVAMHIGRSTAYGASGLVTGGTLLDSLVLTVTLMAGNLLGRRLRQSMKESSAARIELGSLVLCVALALAGLT
jgi:hypothetical protein